MPGAVNQNQSRWGGPSAFGNQLASASAAAAASNNEFDDFEKGTLNVNQASAIADYDFGVDEDSEIGPKDVEMISHTCAMSVKNARINADLTQAQLAKKINEKTSVITEVESGTCKYNAQLINRIEKAMTGCRIDRGRKKKRK